MGEDYGTLFYKPLKITSERVEYFKENPDALELRLYEFFWQNYPWGREINTRVGSADPLGN